MSCWRVSSLGLIRYISNVHSTSIFKIDIKGRLHKLQMFTLRILNECIFFKNNLCFGKSELAYIYKSFPNMYNLCSHLSLKLRICREGVNLTPPPTAYPGFNPFKAGGSEPMYSLEGRLELPLPLEKDLRE